MLPVFKMTVAAAALAASIGVARADDCALLAQYGISCQDIQQALSQFSSSVTNVQTATQSADVSQGE